jgi:hypothetical protein
MKEYLLYLFGELTEYRSEKYPDNRFWKNDEYGIVLELEKSGKLWVYYKIWDSFSMFFSSEYDDTQQVMKSVLEEHLKLGGITPHNMFKSIIIGLEEHLKLGGITPCFGIGHMMLKRWESI